MSDATDYMVEKHAGSPANLTLLDISYCLKITCKGLETLGKNCKSLIHLRRNRQPPECSVERNASQFDDSEAMVFANTASGLQHLELGFGSFGDLGLDAILSKCKALCHLGIQGCWSVELTDNLEYTSAQLEFFKSPWITDYVTDYDEDGDEEFASTESDHSEFL